jgi:CBS domain-containing protein
LHMSIESVTVESIMTKDVKTANEHQSLKAVASIMSKNNIGSVLIVPEAENTPVGILTERDIVHIAGMSEVLMLHLLARETMSKPVITIDSRSSIQDAIQSMKLNNIRRLPVVNKVGKMVGIITDKDIFRAIINSQSLVASISEKVTIEYRPMYERFSEFMMGEMLLPRGGSSNPN